MWTQTGDGRTRCTCGLRARFGLTTMQSLRPALCRLRLLCGDLAPPWIPDHRLLRGCTLITCEM